MKIDEKTYNKMPKDLQGMFKRCPNPQSEEVLAQFPDSKGQLGRAKNDGSEQGNKIYGAMKHETKNPEPRGDEGSAARFFYCAKTSKADRNEGLDSYLTVKYNNVICEENMAVVQLLKKVISDSEALNFSIEECGENITAQCPRGSLSTILMATKKTTASQILNLLMHSLTSDCTQDVNCVGENGGSLVESVEQLKKWILNTTSENLELALGVNRAALEMLSKINAEENWSPATNSHSTVKPTDLMRYLCRLVTPPGGVVLDPFMGSGSTGKAAVLEGFDFIGIELDESYVEIAKARINHVRQNNKNKENNMVRIIIRFVNKEGPMEFPVKERRVYVRGDCTIGQAEKIVDRFKEKFKGVNVVRWFRDEIYIKDVEPGAVYVEP